LYTSDSIASAPSASCTRIANEPRSRHSVGLESPGEPVAVAIAAAAVVVVEGVMVTLTKGVSGVVGSGAGWSMPTTPWTGRTGATAANALGTTTSRAANELAKRAGEPTLVGGNIYKCRFVLELSVMQVLLVR
jgi:hypothetical protein